MGKMPAGKRAYRLPTSDCGQGLCGHAWLCILVLLVQIRPTWVPPYPFWNCLAAVSPVHLISHYKESFFTVCAHMFRELLDNHHPHYPHRYLLYVHFDPSYVVSEFLDSFLTAHSCPEYQHLTFYIISARQCASGIWTTFGACNSLIARFVSCFCISYCARLFVYFTVKMKTFLTILILMNLISLDILHTMMHCIIPVFIILH